MRHICLILLAAIAAIVPLQAQDRLDSDVKLRRAEMIIENFYVDEVDGDTLATEAIRAMLKTLDPHSAYSTPSETREFTEPLDGRFSGIGIQFNMLEDTVYVIQPTSGGPSERVGILPGDRIISANDTVIAGKKMPNRDVMKILRGPKGSVVKLDVKRGDETVTFFVTRDDIPLYSVDETFMADPTTGYIRVTRFAEETAQEIAEAIAKLRAQGMRNLIIDLSDNGGGYLGAAFEAASEFLPAGTPVVSTAGRRFPPQTYATEGAGDFQNGRLVIIANQYSASAAEILSGAIQDNDRGLIVGRRTFGKGLVQRPFSFPDGSMIRLTVSRYYTPSGRCIQKHYEKGKGEDYQREVFLRLTAGELWSADSIVRPDSLRYETLRHHRPVYGGGGIIPDVFVPADTSYYSTYYRDMMAKGLINRAAIKYVENHRAEIKAQHPDQESFYAGYEVPEELLQSLVALATDNGIEYNEEQWQRSEPIVRAILRGLVARDIYENASYFRAIAPLNKDFQEALRLINDPERYNALLRGQPQDEPRPAAEVQ